MISAGIGRFGPYIKHGKIYKSLTAEDDVLTIGLNRAVSLLAEPTKGRAAPTPLRVLGEHPDDKQPVALFRGRYGPYVSHDGLIASLPRSMNAEGVTLDAALELLKQQLAKGKKPRRGKATKAVAAKTKKTAAGKGKAKARKGDDKAATDAASN